MLAVSGGPSPVASTQAVDFGHHLGAVTATTRLRK